MHLIRLLRLLALVSTPHYELYQSSFAYQYPASALSLLNPLVGSLSALLLALEAVVDNLLAVVEQLLNSILTGLSIGLAGLTL